MHITKYGNRYTDKEWTEMQAYFKAEEKKDNAISAKMAGLEKYLRRQLAEEGLNGKQEDIITRLFRYGNYEEANIQFSSESRKAKLDNLWQRWNVAMSKIYDEAVKVV